MHMFNIFLKATSKEQEIMVFRGNLKNAFSECSRSLLEICSNLSCTCKESESMTIKSLVKALDKYICGGLRVNAPLEEWHY